MTGSGMETKMAPNFVKIPSTIIKMADHCTTRLLPTCKQESSLQPVHHAPAAHLQTSLQLLQGRGLTHLGDADDADVDGGRRGAVAGAHQPIDQATDAFDENP